VAAGLAKAARLETGDVMRLDRSRLRQAAPEARSAFVSAASLCAGGGERPPRRERVAALAERLCGDGDVVATLAGARIEACADSVRFMREAGEAARRGLSDLTLAPGVPAVWDGRYEILADEASSVRRLAGAARRLPRVQQQALLAVRPSARGAAPLIVGGRGGDCPILGAGGPAARYLGLERLLGACGAVDREP
jgi:tRNA(Ile)-lysidine synthase